MVSGRVHGVNIWWNTHNTGTHVMPQPLIDIPLSDIYWPPERQREYDPEHETRLAGFIKVTNLLHQRPLVVAPDKIEVKGERKWRGVAGFHRYRACLLIGLETAPAAFAIS